MTTLRKLTIASLAVALTALAAMPVSHAASNTVLMKAMGNVQQQHAVAIPADEGGGGGPPAAPPAPTTVQNPQADALSLFTTLMARPAEAQTQSTITPDLVTQVGGPPPGGGPGGNPCRQRLLTDLHDLDSDESAASNCTATEILPLQEGGILHSDRPLFPVW